MPTASSSLTNSTCASNATRVAHRQYPSTKRWLARILRRVDPKIGFTNIHYFAAGATLFGTDVKGAYEFDGQKYLGYNTKHPLNKCTDCHDVHALTVKVEACAACHGGASDPKDPATYRMDPRPTSTATATSRKASRLRSIPLPSGCYAAIQAYAKEKGTPIVYDAASLPVLLRGCKRRRQARCGR